jgi:hypothetical protein
MQPLSEAFKEWAVICQALAEGRQGVLLRKGGIAEDGGTFRVQNLRFWLYPTFLHQQRDGIVPEALPLLAQAETERPPDHQVRLSHFAEVAGIYELHDIVGALSLVGLHMWSSKTVETRFAYRHPGLTALVVRVWRAATPVFLTETPEFAGCRSWVDLGRALPTEDATPVLDAAAFYELRRTLEDRLRPTAMA